MLVDYVIDGIFIVLFMGAGLLLARIIVREWRVFSQLRKQGVTVQGQITGRRRLTYRSSQLFYLRYSYECDGRSYSGEQRVSKRHYAAWGDRMPVTICCLLDHPATARLMNDHTARIQIIGFAFLVCMLLLMVIGIVANAVLNSHPT